MHVGRGGLANQRRIGELPSFLDYYCDKPNGLDVISAHPQRPVGRRHRRTWRLGKALCHALAAVPPHTLVRARRRCPDLTLLGWTTTTTREQPLLLW